VAEEAFGTITQATAKAATVLLALLDDASAHVRHRAAKDLLELHTRHVEFEELAVRMKAVEQKLERK
jgi:hypothetical protein